jgi:hypothetical protein
MEGMVSECRSAAGVHLPGTDFDPVSSGRQRARCGKAALRLSAGRVPGAPIEFAQGVEDGVDADRRL